MGKSAKERKVTRESYLFLQHLVALYIVNIIVVSKPSIVSLLAGETINRFETVNRFETINRFDPARSTDAIEQRRCFERRSANNASFEIQKVPRFEYTISRFEYKIHHFRTLPAPSRRPCSRAFL